MLRLRVAQGGFNTKAIQLFKDTTIEPEIIKPEITVENKDTQVYVGTQKSVIDLLGIKVMYNGQDVIDNSALVTIDDSQVNFSKAGEYKVVVTAKDSQGNDVIEEYTIRVINTPVMKYDASEIVVDSSFDPMTGIVVNDYDGKDITDKVKVIENNVDLFKSGVYKVIYSVVNGLDDEFIFEREVKVIDKKVDDNKPSDEPQIPQAPDDKPQTPEKPVEDKPQVPNQKPQTPVNNDKVDSDVLGDKITTINKEIIGEQVNKKEDNKKVDGVKTGDPFMIMPYVILALCAVGAYITIKKSQL